MDNFILSPISLQDFSHVIDSSINRAMEKQFHALTAPQAEKYLTRKETAALLNVSLPTLNEYTKGGKIKGYRFGARVLYKQSEIEAALTKINVGRTSHV